MEKYFSDDFIQKTVEKISTEAVSCIMEQIKSAINEKQQRSVRTIEERAKEYAPDPFLSALERKAYIAGATEQKAIYDAELHERFQKVLNGQKWDLIDKACEWFDDYLMEIGYPDDWMRDSPNIESGRERFIKAMEK